MHAGALLLKGEQKPSDATPVAEDASVVVTDWAAFQALLRRVCFYSCFFFSMLCMFLTPLRKFRVKFRRKFQQQSSDATPVAEDASVAVADWAAFQALLRRLCYIVRFSATFFFVCMLVFLQVLQIFTFLSF